MTRKEIANILKQCRLDAGFTQARAAEAIGRNQKTLASWETGQSQPDANTLFELCDLYGVSVDEVFGYNKKKARYEITGEEMEVIQKYRQLDPRGRAAVMDTVERELLYSTSASRAADAKKLADDVLECMAGADLNEPVRKANE